MRPPRRPSPSCTGSASVVEVSPFTKREPPSPFPPQPPPRPQLPATQAAAATQPSPVLPHAGRQSFLGPSPTPRGWLDDGTISRMQAVWKGRRVITSRSQREVIRELTRGATVGGGRRAVGRFLKSQGVTPAPRYEPKVRQMIRHLGGQGR